MKDYNKISVEILNFVGGKSNITNVTHCMTRLRINIINNDIDIESIKKINGVIGVVFSGGQLQIIIGQEVDELYKVFIGFISDVENQPRITKKKLSINIVLDVLSGCLTPLIPIIIASSMFKMILSLLGSEMFNILNKNGGIYQSINIVADAGFYFLPIFVAYSSAKKMNVNPMISMLLGAILIHPLIINLAQQSASLDLMGFDVKINNYTSSIIPSILTVFIYKYIEKYLRLLIPESIRSVGVPTLSVMIMFPVMICLIAPAGAFAGSYICNALLGLYKITGAFGVAVVGALFMLLVLTGMHLVLISQLILVFQTTGHESLVCPAATAASFAVAGVALGSILCLKNKELRNLSVGYLIAVIIGGVTEPTLYGVCIRYKKPIIGLMSGGFLGALYMGLMHVTCNQLLPTSSFLAALSFAGSSSMNFINGLIGCIIALTVSALVTFILDCKDVK